MDRLAFFGWPVAGLFGFFLTTEAVPFFFGAELDRGAVSGVSVEGIGVDDL